MTLRYDCMYFLKQFPILNAENSLADVQNEFGDRIGSSWYDVDGARVKKTSGSTTTYTFLSHYEEEVANGVTTATTSAAPR